MKHFFQFPISLNTIRRNLPRFIGTGLFIISVLLLVVTVTDRITEGAVRKALIADAVFSNSSSLISDKKLPIYCVKTDKKQIALTFDGAWGDGGYGHKKLSLYSHGFRGSVSEDKIFNINIS